MSLQLGLDFGTATLSVATVRDKRTFDAQLIPIDGQDLTSSAVWFDREPGTALVESASPWDRTPKQVLVAARARWTQYWRRRVETKQSLAGWDEWRRRGHEADMLMSFFKPELSDDPRPTSMWVSEPRMGEFDGLRQSQEVMEYRMARRIADPGPEPQDYLAATAALLQVAVQRAVRQFGGEKVSRIVIGVPSLPDDANDQELKRAKERRRKAVALARIEHDFGDRRFEVEFAHEALAAAWDVKLDGKMFRVAPASRAPQILVIDAGAGTTDVSLLELERRNGEQWRPRVEVARASHRLAGRDVNLAILKTLADRDLKQAVQALDERSWQMLLDGYIEEVKLKIANGVYDFRIPLMEIDAHWSGASIDEARRNALRRVSYGCVERELFLYYLQQVFDPWKRAMRTFLDAMGSSGQRPVAVFLVGGAFRLGQLQEMLKECLDEAGLTDISVRFSDNRGDAQRAVVRGLARLAAGLA